MLDIPGGFVKDGEKVEDAPVREMLEETNLNIKPTEILGVYSDPKRDPRGHVVNIVFIRKIIGGELKADDAEAFEWVSYEELKDKQFIKTIDHLKIMEDYQEWKNLEVTGSQDKYTSPNRIHVIHWSTYFNTQMVKKTS